MERRRSGETMICRVITPPGLAEERGAKIYPPELVTEKSR